MSEVRFFSRPLTPRVASARSVLARVALICIPIAVLLAVVYECTMLHMWSLRLNGSAGVGIIGGADPLLYWKWQNDRVLTAALGVLVMVVGAILSPYLRRDRKLFDGYFCIGGLVVLLGGAVGLLWNISNHREAEILQSSIKPTLFVGLLWTMAAVAVCIALARRRLPLNASVIHLPTGKFFKKILLRSAVFGVVPVLLALAVLWAGQTDSYLASMYLALASSYAGTFFLAVALGYFFLSLLEKKAYDRGASDRITTPADTAFLVATGAAIFVVTAGYVAVQRLYEEGVLSDHRWLYRIMENAYPLLSMLVSMMTLVAALRVLRVVQKYPLGWTGGVILALTHVVSSLMNMVSGLSEPLMYISGSASYGRISIVSSYVGLGLAILLVTGLVLVSVDLFRRTTVSPAVPVTPVLRLLPTVSTLLISALLLQKSQEVEQILRWTRLQTLISAFLTAAYYIVIACLLARAKIRPEYRTDDDDSPFLVDPFEEIPPQEETPLAEESATEV